VKLKGRKALDTAINNLLSNDSKSNISDFLYSKFNLWQSEA
jgi:hypothetical protein